jgi:hypothetical protein
MNVENLYNRLCNIFVEYTTHNWKNGWEHEGDILSKEFTIQKNVPWNNLFLLQKTKNFLGTGISVDGPNGFKIEVKKESDNSIRIDIEVNQLCDIDIYYYVNNELSWFDNQEFIIEICQQVYDATIKTRDAVCMVPKNIYGLENPDFVKKFNRDRKLNDLGI